MIICKQCGHQNPDGANFCKQCNAYLGFFGDKVIERASDRQSGRMVSVVKRSMIMRSVFGRRADLDGGDVPTPPEPTRIPGEKQHERLAFPAAPLVARAAPQREPADSIAVRLPTGAQARLRAVQGGEPQQDLLSGQVLCSACGSPNEPSRT